MEMAKATAEGGPTNTWQCADCGCVYVAGAPRCPECPSTEHAEPAGVTAPEDGAEVPAEAAPEPDAPPSADPDPEPAQGKVAPKAPARRTAPPS